MWGKYGKETGFIKIKIRWLHLITYLLSELLTFASVYAAGA